jgi:hypothetical protein
MTRRKQTTMFTPEYRQSSSLHPFTETKERILARKKPEFGMIGLCAGDFQVITINGRAAITAAATERMSAQRGPLVSHKTTQRIVSTAITLSILDQLYLPLMSSTIVVAVAPSP